MIVASPVLVLFIDIDKAPYDVERLTPFFWHVSGTEILEIALVKRLMLVSIASSQ